MDEILDLLGRLAAHAESAGRRPRGDGPPVDASVDAAARAPDVDVLARQLLAEAREEVARADAKAATLLAGSLALTGAVVAGVLSSNWKPTNLALPWSAAWFLGATIAIAGIVSLVLAVLPRLTPTRGRPEVYYFADAAGSASVEDLDRRLAATGAHARVLTELRDVSRIAVAKYARITAGIRLLGLAAVLVLGSAVANEIGLWRVP